MTLRTGHGNGRGKPRIEVMPADELPKGVPADADPSSPDDFDDRGKFAPGNAIASKGGRARAGRTRLAHQLGLSRLTEDAALAPYRGAADAFRRAQCSELAATVGGGMCGPGPSSIVASAALQLAMSRYLSDQGQATGDPKLLLSASRLANESRQNLLAAHELCAREAVAREVKPNGRPIPSTVAHGTRGARAMTDQEKVLAALGRYPGTRLEGVQIMAAVREPGPVIRALCGAGLVEVRLPAGPLGPARCYLTSAGWDAVRDGGLARR